VKSVPEIAQSLADALKVDEKNTTLPTLQNVVHELFTGFGGIKEFVGQMVACYKAAKPGSQVQARMAECLIDIVKIAHDRGLLGTSVMDAEALNDEDLEAEIRRESERAVKAVLEAENEAAH
jgi:hypothetical protein